MLTIQQEQGVVPLPADAGGVAIREATDNDLPFIDRLQKGASKSLGFMTRATLEGKVKLCEVVVAERGGVLIGYAIGSDRYMKREDTGIVYQVCVSPEARRGLVGAALVRGLFERWPWGVRLACCWCAQDLAANRFWESLGFVPLAYRGGSTSKRRLHVFWQCRVHQGDDCPWWYPSQTTGGSIREDRLILPMDPNQHWTQTRPVLLPGMRNQKQIEADAKANKPKRAKKPKKPAGPMIDPNNIASGGFRFGPPVPPPEPEPTEQPKPEKKSAEKNDPALVPKVRTLRDAYLCEVNAGQVALPHAGKYDMAKALPQAVQPLSPQAALPEPRRLLPAA